MENIYFIDLGLPSGTLWADRNLGAKSPEGCGEYFRFGETVPFTEKSPEYKQQNFGGDISSTIYDVAHVKYNIGFCIPDTVQLWELFECCSQEWGKYNNVDGLIIIGPNKNKIFLPAAGIKDSDGTLDQLGTYGHYRSSVFKVDGSPCFFFNENYMDDGFCKSNIGITIRPIKFIKKDYFYDRYGRLVR